MDPYKDERARLRFERDDFKRRSTIFRKEWQRLKSERRQLDALEAMSRMHEYARTAKQRQAALDALPNPSGEA